MAGQITYTVNNSIQTSNGNPMTASHLLVGSVTQRIQANLQAGGQNVLLSNSWNAPGTSTGDLVALFLVASQPITIQTNGNGQIGVQTIAAGGTWSAGSFVLAFQGQVTGLLSYSATAGAVQVALQSLPNIGQANISCSGGPLPGTPITCTFSGPLLNQTVPLITGNVSNIAGSLPTLIIANAPGTPADVLNLSANIDFSWDSQCGLIYPFQGPVSALYVTNVNPCSVQGIILTY